MSIYETLIDRRPGLLGRKHWLGNLRWIAEEMDRAGRFEFHTCPLDPSEKQNHRARRVLLGLKLVALDIVERCEYRADSLSLTAGEGIFSMLLPLERYGAWIELTSQAAGAGLQISTARETGAQPSVEKPFSTESEPGRIVWRDGAYTVVFQFLAGEPVATETGFRLSPDSTGTLRLAVAFHADEARARAEAEALFSNPDQAREESRRDWEEYLASCPVVELPEDLTWQSPEGPVTYSREEIVRRQYWHWHCLLANVYDLPFNRLPVFIAPDKTNWFGVWSNDGPECLRALAHTRRHDLARDGLLGYIRTAINAQGDLSWYLHGTGEGCLGRPRDIGRLSHGVPTIVTAVAEYVRVTGDAAILDEPAGHGRTVWEQLVHYMKAVYERRDLDHDGLVEWNNLWEGGADDKVGPFFSRANLREWMDAVVNLDGAELEAFYVRNGRPVANLYEIAFFLHALQSLKELAEERGDDSVADYAQSRFDETCRVLEERHWDERDGFYYDWDVRENRLVVCKNQDAFYLPRFLKNPERAKRLFAHLEDPAEFRLRFTPTLARCEQGFDPKGYWCGGYWPRESNYIALALNAAGYGEQAVELLVKALCAGTGKIIPENMDPVTGEDSTGITGMAYNVLVALALWEIAGARTPDAETCQNGAKARK